MPFCHSAAKSSFVGAYHASLTQQTKSHVQQQFQGSSNMRCVVATIAFGMVHYNVPWLSFHVNFLVLFFSRA